MRYFQFERFVAVMALSASFGCLQVMAQTQQNRPQTPSITGVGTAPTTADMGPVAWMAGPSGKGLPEGSGTAKQGAPIYLVKCSMCHGQEGRGVHWRPMEFSPIAGLPIALPARKTEGPHEPWVPPITSAAPFPAVIFNTIAVEMPMFRAGTLTADEVYALTAFILFKNGLIKEDEVMNRETLPKVQMPNGKYFPASDDVYMDMKKRGCYKTYGVCVGD